MKRRIFLKNSAIGTGILAISPTFLLANEGDFRKFKIIQDFDLKYDEKDFPARLWNPLPFNAEFQKVKFLNFRGNYNSFDINCKNPYDAKVLYTKWKKSSKKKILHLEMEIETKYRSVNPQLIEKASKLNLPVPNDIKLFLQPTYHIPTNGKIADKAKELTNGINDRFEKVKAIYDWVTRVTFRDPKVIGCGTGNAGKMIDSGYFGGKCTDISSLFVALLRSAGIPSREVFGIRLGLSHFSKALGKADKNGFADITTWQHCRVEYYIPGIGWIPSDPADITKLELVENLKFNNAKVQKLKEKYLHSWEMNWVGFNWGRDFTLFPKPIQYPLNMLGYPYAEVYDEVLNYYMPKSFSYRFTSQAL